jgi:transposase
MRGCGGEFSPPSSKGSARCRQLGTETVLDAPVDPPAARRHPATDRAARRARSSAIPELLQLRAPTLYGYGPRFTAFIGELSGSQRDSRSAVQEFCSSVLGVPISRGAIQRAVDRVSEAITPYYEAIAEKARGVPVNYIDETAWSQHGVLAWLWVMVNATVAFFMVQASRSQAAFEALVERWAGILVSDGYAVYRQWMHGRQACLAHLIRQARGLSERKEPELAKFGRRVMVERQRLVHWATAPPTSGEVQTWYARMVHLIDQYRRRQDEAGTFARSWIGRCALCGGSWWRKG